MRMRAVAVVAMVATAAALFAMPSARAEQCGSQAGGAACPNCLCCSQWGWCGTTSDYCGVGCQGQCDGSCGGTPTPNNTAPPLPPSPTPSPRPRPRPSPKPKPPKGGGVASIITEDMFDEMLEHRDADECPAKGFYTYADFLAAAKAFPGFGTTGSADARKRELAAFLAQTSHETTGGWASAPDGEFAWGYCFKEEVGAAAGPDFCEPSTDYPCAPGKKYYGRGPIQISYNLNYGQAAKALGADILANPDLVAADPKIAFKTAVWFWMTPQSPKPSCHDVMTGKWKPSGADTAARRLPGYGVVTNVINGGIECGHGDNDARVAGRIGFYKRYCDLLGVSYGDNLDCGSQTPFAQAS